MQVYSILCKAHRTDKRRILQEFTTKAEVNTAKNQTALHAHTANKT